MFPGHCLGSGTMLTKHVSSYSPRSLKYILLFSPIFVGEQAVGYGRYAIHPAGWPVPWLLHYQAGSPGQRKNDRKKRQARSEGCFRTAENHLSSPLVFGFVETGRDSLKTIQETKTQKRIVLLPLSNTLNYFSSPHTKARGKNFRSPVIYDGLIFLAVP